MMKVDFLLCGTCSAMVLIFLIYCIQRAVKVKNNMFYVVFFICVTVGILSIALLMLLFWLIFKLVAENTYNQLVSDTGMNKLEKILKSCVLIGAFGFLGFGIAQWSFAMKYLQVAFNIEKTVKNTQTESWIERFFKFYWYFIFGVLSIGFVTFIGLEIRQVNMVPARIEEHNNMEKFRRIGKAGAWVFWLFTQIPSYSCFLVLLFAQIRIFMVGQT